MATTLPPQDTFTSDLAAAARSNDRLRIVELLDIAIQEACTGLPKAWLAALRNGIGENDWGNAGALFAGNAFISPTGEFLFVAPYSARRAASVDTRLSLLAGHVMPRTPTPNPERAIYKLFGQRPDRYSTILPVSINHAAGIFGSEDGEAFVVPDGWPFPCSEEGPALNDMSEQARRFVLSECCIRRIFDDRSADFIVSSVRANQHAIRHLEYQLHEYGHSCGIGLETKLALDLLSNAWYRAVEEWRSDAIAFSLAPTLLDEETAAQVICSNICTRLGMDAHRLGGMDSDTDVNASLLTFSSLVEGEMIDSDRDGRLKLVDCTPEGVIAAAQRMAMDGITLTRRELRLDHVTGIWQLYGTRPITPAARLAFRTHILNPCAGIFTALR